MTTAGPYRNLISARSRRLRTTGVLLLVAALLMAGYGAVVIMPRMGRVTVEAESTLHGKASALSGRAGPTRSAAASSAARELADGAVRSERARKVLLVWVVFVWTYWAVCGCLILALFTVAWLDFREVSRSYVAQRVALLRETASRHDDEGLTGAEK